MAMAEINTSARMHRYHGPPNQLTLGYGGDYALTAIDLNLRSLGPKPYLHSITVFQNVLFWYQRAWRAVSPSTASKNTQKLLASQQEVHRTSDCH